MNEPTTKEKSYTRLSIGLERLEPWQVIAAYQLIMNTCGRHGFTDIDDLNCSIHIALYSLPDARHDVEGAKAALAELGIHGSIEELPDA